MAVVQLKQFLREEISKYIPAWKNYVDDKLDGFDGQVVQQQVNALQIEVDALQVEVDALQAQTGAGNYTEGAGIKIVGTEIRLSIGTLPPSQ
jgi:hypothetical protein